MSHTYNLRSGRCAPAVTSAVSTRASAAAAASMHTKSYNLRSKGSAATGKITMSASVRDEDRLVGIVIDPKTHKVIGYLNK